MMNDPAIPAGSGTAFPHDQDDDAFSVVANPARRTRTTAKMEWGGGGSIDDSTSASSRGRRPGGGEERRRVASRDIWMAITAEATKAVGSRRSTMTMKTCLSMAAKRITTTRTTQTVIATTMSTAMGASSNGNEAGRPAV